MTNPNPDQLPMPKYTGEPPKKPNPLPGILGGLGLLALVGGGAYYWNVVRPARAAQAAVAAVAKTAPVRKANLEMRLRVTGQTSARQYAFIVAPRIRFRGVDPSMVLLKLAASGSMVKKGDVVAEFDPQAMKDRLDDQIATIKDYENNIKKRKVEQELDMENLQQSLRQAKAALDKAKLDFRTTQIRMDIDRELLQLAVDEAEAAYKEQQTDVPQKIASQKSDMRILEITKRIEDINGERQQGDLAKMVIKAPMDGMVVLQTMFRPGGDQVTLAVGDQVRPGQPILKIIDARTMQVEGQINQSESSSFRIGQTADVSLDAFPGSHYQAKVYAIGALATSGGRQQFFIRNVPVRVQMINPDKNVIPDLSASADVLLAKADNVLAAPASAVEQNGDKSYVYVKNGQAFEKRAVRLGMNNGTQVAILEGVQEGEVVRVN
ncbi:MAG: HlyD family efflux transporter periplasmic adaptor subunit [Acidobacteria bacterium]|nr:HlyD family efflux transporter periplasmic adaptor subunit [Acidobacteriota bacterium]